MWTASLWSVHVRGFQQPCLSCMSGWTCKSPVCNILVDRQTDWCTDRLTDVRTDWLMYGQTDWCTDRLMMYGQTDWCTDRLSDVQTDWLMYRQTDWCTETDNPSSVRVHINGLRKTMPYSVLCFQGFWVKWEDHIWFWCCHKVTPNGVDVDASIVGKVSHIENWHHPATKDRY